MPYTFQSLVFSDPQDPLYPRNRSGKEGPGDLKKLGSEMCKALEDIGFCYLKNHGISEQLVCIF
jgi:hypothetical protein